MDVWREPGAEGGAMPAYLDVAAPMKAGAWRQRASAHVAALQAQLDRIRAMGSFAPHDDKLAEKAECILDAAREAAERWTGPVWALNSAKDRVLANIHEAESILLQIAPEEELAWRGPAVLAKGMQHLGAEDPRLRLLSEHLARNGNRLDPRYRDLAVGVLHAANHTEEVEIARVRNFRDILLVCFLATATLATLLILSAYWAPDALAEKLCFERPERPADGARTEMVCPTRNGPGGGDALLVASLGAGAATLTGAVAIRHLQGSAVPYMVPMGLLLLRIPVGALSAILGLILIHGDFIPGLTALDRRPQIAAWAVMFGIGQEGLTRLLDKKGTTVLENVRGSWRAVDAPPPAPRTMMKAENLPAGPGEPGAPDAPAGAGSAGEPPPAGPARPRGRRFRRRGR
ncbi:hypothetical protein GCM10027168_36570 [Streptomyces capparidis]